MSRPLLLLLLPACGTAPPQPVPATATEVSPLILPLSGEAAAAAQELSGLDWCGPDRLLLLPQEPEGYVFTLPRHAVEAAVAGSTAPLVAARLPLDDGGAARLITGFDGFEAIACLPDGRLWVTVELRPGGGWLLPGRYTEAGVVLAPEQRVALPSRSHVRNKSDETLWLWQDTPWTLHELNTEGAATAYHLDEQGILHTLPAPVLPFRVTDATAPDAAGRLWLLNYQWEGDRALRVDRDPLLERWGYGPTHARTPGQRAERLVAVRVTAEGVALEDRAPVQLTLDAAGRNWEGIARLGAGVLLVTDQHPTTLLAYVPLPDP